MVAVANVGGMRRLALLATVVVLAGCGSDYSDVPAVTTVPVPTTAASTIEPATSEPSTTAAPTTAAPTTEPSTTEATTTTAADPVTTSSVAPATPNELGLRAVLDQFREDEILHLLQVRVTNTSDTKMRLTSVQLDWSGMTVVAPTPQLSLIITPKRARSA